MQQTISYVNEKGKTVYQVFTDGACSDNGTADAAAAVGVYFGDNNPHNFSDLLYQSPVTSQTAELVAIRRAYFIIDLINYGRLYEICTDSSYAINCLTKWCHTWKKNGWKCEDGSRVVNRATIKEILEIQVRPGFRNVQPKNVKAHGSCEGNKQADKLAREVLKARRLRWLGTWINTF